MILEQATAIQIRNPLPLNWIKEIFNVNNRIYQVTEQTNAEKVWTPTELIEQDPNSKKGRAGALEWWYTLTAPQEAELNDSFEKRELVRRGRLASTILFFFGIILLLVFSIGIVGRNHVIAIVAPILLLVVAIAAVVNRRGHSNITGLIISFALNLALIIVILTSPGGLSASSLGLFDLLVFVELFVASLLPVNWVFAAAALNIAFIIFDLMTQHRTPNFNVVMATDSYPILLRPIMLHIIVTVVLWLWVRSATQAIARADRAEVIASLEHAVAEQERETAQQKRMLDVSIQQIVETHMRVANGDFSARVPLTQENVLWQIAGSLNNLLTRLQRLQRETQEIQYLRQEHYRLREVLSYVLNVIRGAKMEQQPIRLTQTNTLLDPLLREMNGKSFSSTPYPLSGEKNYSFREQKQE